MIKQIQRISRIIFFFHCFFAFTWTAISLSVSSAQSVSSFRRNLSKNIPLHDDKTDLADCSESILFSLQRITVFVKPSEFHLHNLIVPFWHIRHFYTDVVVGESVHEGFAR